MTRADRSIEDLILLRERLREEVREARGTLKDLRGEIKAARALVDDTRRLAADLAETHVRDVLQAELDRQLAALGAQTRQAIDKSAARVVAEFDKLHDLLLGTDRTDGRPSIPDLLKDPAVLDRARTAARRNTARGGGT